MECGDENDHVFARSGALPDGSYTATPPAGSVSSAAGTPLATDASFNFFFMQADANHDVHANLLDFNLLAGNFNQTGRTFSQGDFNYDGQTNLLDFNILAARFNTALASPAGFSATTIARSSTRADRLTDALLGDVLA